MEQGPMEIPQAIYFDVLQRLLFDSDFAFVVRQLAILAAMKGYMGEERCLSECYEKLQRLP